MTAGHPPSPPAVACGCYSCPSSPNAHRPLSQIYLDREAMQRGIQAHHRCPERQILVEGLRGPKFRSSNLLACRLRFSCCSTTESHSWKRPTLSTPSLSNHQNAAPDRRVWAMVPIVDLCRSPLLAEGSSDMLKMPGAAEPAEPAEPVVHTACTAYTPRSRRSRCPVTTPSEWLLQHQSSHKAARLASNPSLCLLRDSARRQLLAARPLSSLALRRWLSCSGCLVWAPQQPLQPEPGPPVSLSVPAAELVHAARGAQQMHGRLRRGRSAAGPHPWRGNKGNKTNLEASRLSYSNIQVKSDVV